VIIAAGLYGRSALAAYKGRLDQLPGLQAAISLAGNRIETLENAYRTWSSQQDSWALQLKQMEAKFDGGMRTVRKQAEEIVARAQARMQDDLDKRTAALQARVDKLQSAQNTADARLTSFREELDRVREASGREFSEVHREILDRGVAQEANLNRRLAQVGEQSEEGKRNLQAVRQTIDRERIEFEVGVNHGRELVPGVNLEVNRTNVAHQRFDGRVWLAADRRTLEVRGQGLQQPLVFYTQKDDRPRELVFTRVTKYSVVGYILQPPGGRTASPTASSALSPGAHASSLSDGDI
jgi:hypothetical protein